MVVVGSLGCGLGGVVGVEEVFIAEGRLGNRRVVVVIRSMVSVLSFEAMESTDSMVSVDLVWSFRATSVSGIVGLVAGMGGVVSFVSVESEWGSVSLCDFGPVIEVVVVLLAVVVPVVKPSFDDLRAVVGVWEKSFHFLQPSKSISACIQPHSMTFLSSQTKLTG